MKTNLLDIKGMSKWVETAMSPVPERSHMLKTWPTKAGPPPFLFEFKPETLTVEGNPELDSAEELIAELEEEESESYWVELKGGFGEESANLRGKQTLEGEIGMVLDGCSKDEEEDEAFRGLKRETTLEAVELKKLKRLLLWFRSDSDGKAIHTNLQWIQKLGMCVLSQSLVMVVVTGEEEVERLK